MTAAAHHAQLRDDERIGYHALYGAAVTATDDIVVDDQVHGQLALTDLGADNSDHEGEVSA
ncbi:integrase [Mycolicibacterium sp. jd]|uniref:Integrase n=1 Tax=Mycolicibacterium austroafricanum TaxID=39687 RepID=A0ABT8HM79_MYCAO|nr:integrase [Mycolicibacterium austroafricanum]MDN4521858.1 integrase [Mycolicibacterium austroafricanum]